MNEKTIIENAFKNIQGVVNAKKEINDILPEEIIFMANVIQDQIDSIKINAEKLKG